MIHLDIRLPEIKEQEPLARYVAWRIGGPASFFAAAATEGELVALLRWSRERALPVLLLGGGTNMLISDAGFPGLVIRYRAKDTRIETASGTPLLYAAAGAPMAGTVRRYTGEGWRGMQWAEGLPGTIGGAVYGNAGCYGGEVASTAEHIWLLEGEEVVQRAPAELGFDYRTSALKRRQRIGIDPGPIVLAAAFRVTSDDPQVLHAEMEAIALSRRSKTPSGSSCGSVFKNPPNDAAGRLIEAAGLKGTQVGSALISDKHGNYIINTGGASSDDVLRLIELIRQQVRRQFGVALELEVQLVGFDSQE